MPFNKPAIEFSIPERTLTTLSFCEPTPRHLQRWVDQLPMINLGEASRLLYHAILELNQLIVDPDERLKLVEIIRPAMLFVSRSLGKHYLNKPIFLPKKALKISRLATALDNQLATTYKIIIFDIAHAENTRSRKRKKILLVALERALRCLSYNILRSHQLYSTPSANSWHELHQLYLIAEANQILDTAVPDKEYCYISRSTIAETYKRTLMLSCCQTNQLRQSDIRHVYEAIELWAKHVVFGSITENSDFVIDLGSDKPPCHTDTPGNRRSPLQRGMDFSRLVDYLSNYLAQSESNLDAYVKEITIPEKIDKDILRHLTTTWHSRTDRAHNRLPSNKPVDLCIGFSAAHYYTSGGINFETQLQAKLDDSRVKPNQQGAKSNQFFVGEDVASISDVKDVWSGIFEMPDTELEGNSDSFLLQAKHSPTISDDIHLDASKPPFLANRGSAHSSSHKIYRAQLVNTSPVGYCIRWKNEIPKEVKTGEAIGINEHMGQTWNVAVIRWIHQVSATESLMGVELLAHGAVPCGAQAISHQKQKSDYIRALLIPAPPSAKQSATLITPNLPFKQGMQVVLNQHGELTYGRLSKRTAVLGNFFQFIFEPDKQSNENGNDTDDKLEDAWPDI